MERASDKHSPRLDDAMADDTRSMVQGAPVEARDREERLQEGGEAPEAVLDPDLADGRDLRSELARHLRPSVFPADRARLVAVATDEHAPDPVLALLGALPAGTEFANVEAVWEAIGGRPEQRA
jgi:hypothetical protein